MRQMGLIGFMQAKIVQAIPRPRGGTGFRSQNFGSREYYEGIGRTLEAGKFHLAFFDITLAIPDKYADDFRRRSATIRAAGFDPVSVALVMGLATEKLGIGVTYSTTYYEPFHVARVFATLDLLLNGRMAWNVVTSLNDSEAANFGATKHLGHDLRYDRADEFMEVVLGHWDSWEEDAILFDRETGLFADPAKVHRLDHKGKFFTSRGPFTVPRSPQGRPIIIQAGQSGRGKTFATRWGELMFVIYPNLTVAKRQYAETKQSLAEQDKDISIAPAIYPIVAETQAEAEDRFAEIDRLAKPIDTLTAVCGKFLNLRFCRPSPWTNRFPRKSLLRSAGCRRSVTVTSSSAARPTRPCVTSCSSAGGRHCANSRISWAPPSKSLTASKSGSREGRATVLWWRRRKCPAPTTTSCGW